MRDIEISQNSPKRIERPHDHQLLFTICTLVNDLSLYQNMCTSLRGGGFAGDDVEYLFIDNVAGNVIDAYAGLNCLISHARGRYVILCHQDIVLLDDGREELVARLGELDRLDPAWALAGNAGGRPDGRLAVRITDPSGSNRHSQDLPCRVASLDENFLVMRNSSRLAFSRNLEGFHLYGADICLQAECRGWNAYVIDFHLCHDSSGKIDEEFRKCSENLEKKYSGFFRPRALLTTCTTVALGSSPPVEKPKRFSGFRWYRRAIWKWVRGKPVPPRD